MKFFSSELGHNYETYTFGYCNYCEVESGDSLAGLYAQGYLPYSGSPEAPNTLYMARHARVLLKEFELSSENRRIAKKFDGQFKKEVVPKKDFKIDESFYEFCLTYFHARHGDTMPRERLEFIMASPFITHIIRYTQEDKLLGYVLSMQDGGAEHYWFSFYDLSLAKQSLGLWLMLDCVRDAKERGLAYYYLGTVYGEKALYKTNFEPLEWWGGRNWNSDIKLLKERSRSDASRIVPFADEWKGGKNQF
jgi:arginyl-tRNA--protein-N-Asp/Glu arginylyltransferase